MADPSRVQRCGRAMDPGDYLSDIASFRVGLTYLENMEGQIRFLDEYLIGAVQRLNVDAATQNLIWQGIKQYSAK